ncbi:PRK06770 family protein [Bacillus paramycoides]|uniref:PRK06770 family protein n=1 Tax=Bacillus paramycoides TaxID=2026194 RepID=UPI003D0894A4
MGKKVLTWLGLVAAMGVLTVGVTFGMLELADNPADKQANAEIDTSEYKTVPPEPEAVAVGGALTALSINEYSYQEQVIKEMHHMTHQKVVAEQKWGAIPMSKKNSVIVRDIIKNSNFEKKEELLAIAERWANGDFSKIVEDHNYFWTTQEGSIGKATGAMGQDTERAFVISNFGEDVEKELSDQGDIK